MKFSRSAEDYLEAIYMAEMDGRAAQVTGIAEMLRVRPPSVTEAVRKLSEKGLAEYEKYGAVRLTSAGRRHAKDVYDKHRLLREFFMKIGVRDSTANKDACMAEHVLSRETLERMKDFVKGGKR